MQYGMCFLLCDLRGSLVVQGVQIPGGGGGYWLCSDMAPCNIFLMYIR